MSTLRPTAYDAVIAAAFELLAENPGTSLGDIAARAGVGRATLHRHFSSREQLLTALTKAALTEMEAAAEAACEGVSSYTEALRLTLEALIPLGDRYRFMAADPADDDPEIAAEIARQQDETEHMVDEAKREGAFDPSVPTAWIVQAYDHLLYAAWESVQAGETTAAQASALAWRTLTNGLSGASS